MKLPVLALTVALSVSTGAADVVVWNEAINGDISGDRLNPSSVVLSLGVNTLIASSVSGDREYIRMIVPAGFTLESVVHVSWDSEDPIAFMAVQQGATFTEPPTGTNVGNLLGWSHFGPGEGTVGLDILPRIGTGAGAIGFTPPLAANTYTFWVQQTGPFMSTYRLDFVIAPAPASIATLLFGSVIAAHRRRINSRR